MSLTPAMTKMLLMLGRVDDPTVALQLGQLVGSKAYRTRSANTAMALYRRGLLGIRTGGGFELTDAGRAAIAKLKAGAQ